MNNNDQVKNRRALEALRNGVPNRDAVTVLGCNQPGIEEKFRQLLQNTVQSISESGKNEGMIVSGDFGTGKSHLLEYLMHLALEENFVCSKIVISKETPLFDPIKLYRAAVDTAIVPWRDNTAIVPWKRGNAVTEIATALNPRSQSYADFYVWINQEAGLNTQFAATLFLYERMSNDPELYNRIIRFWSGDKLNSREIRNYLRACRESVTYRLESITRKELSLQAFQFIARLIIAAGYKGWVLLIDEAELIGRYSLLQRAKSYAELARWMGKLDESHFTGLASIFAITGDFQSKILEEKDDFEKVPGRLQASGLEKEAIHAEQGMRVIQNDLIPLQPPDKASRDQTYEKVLSIHATAYQWSPPPVESGEFLSSKRMRQYVKEWITEWDLKRLYPDYKPDIEVIKVDNVYTEDKDLEVESKNNETGNLIT